MNILIALVLLLIGGIIYAFVRNQKPIYVSEVLIKRSFDEVWQKLSDPLNYKELYPNWIKDIRPAADGSYQVEHQFGQSYSMKIDRSEKHGTIDLYIALPRGEEVSRSRIVPIDSHNTAIIHLAHRWAGASPLIWFFHKLTTDRDFRNAKRVIEGG